MKGVAEDPVAKRMRGLDRAFEILEFLRGRRQPMRPNEIASKLKFSPISWHRLERMSER